MTPEPLAEISGIPQQAPGKGAAVDVPPRVDAGSGRNAAEEPIPIGCAVETKTVPLEEQERRDADRRKSEQERIWRELLRSEDERNKTAVGRVFRKLTLSLVLLFAGLGALLLW